MNQLKDIDDGTLRRVDWQEVVPGTLLFRSFAQTFKPCFLTVYAAVLALIVVTFHRFLTPSDGFYKALELTTFHNARTFAESISSGAFLGFIEPFVFPQGMSLIAKGTVLLLGALVLTYFSLAFARIVAVHLASSAHVSMRAAFSFALKRFPSALLVLTLQSALLCALWFGARLISHVTFLSPIAFVLLGFFWFFGFLFLCAYPLALAAIATENTDGFDAISRSLAYVSQRFLFWTFYSALALALVLWGVVLVILFVLCWTCSFNHMTPQSDVFGVIYPLKDFCVWFAAFLPYAYLLAAWIAHNCAIYVILRRSVDGSPFDKCAVNLNSKQRRLRQILTDMQGAPQIKPQFTTQEQTQSNSNEANAEATQPAMPTESATTSESN
ncbi:MAG: hypothetical protein Q4G03_05205 [Planctomycetia bacterium]|nr:hypothetical protein [Planctomycetia bacterium]